MPKIITVFSLVRNDIANTPVKDDDGNPISFLTRKEAEEALEKRKDRKQLLILEAKHNVEE